MLLINTPDTTINYPNRGTTNDVYRYDLKSKDKMLEFIR